MELERIFKPFLETARGFRKTLAPFLHQLRQTPVSQALDVPGCYRLRGTNQHWQGASARRQRAGYPSENRRQFTERSSCSQRLGGEPTGKQGGWHAGGAVSPLPGFDYVREGRLGRVIDAQQTVGDWNFVLKRPADNRTFRTAYSVSNGDGRGGEAEENLRRVV